MIASLLFLYMRHGCVFSDRLSESEDASRHTDGREPQDRSSVERVTPSCHATMDSRASKRGSSSDAPSRHCGSRYASREAVKYRASPPAAVVMKGIPGPICLSDLWVEQHDCDLVRCVMTSIAKRDARRECEAKVQRLCVDKSDKQSEYAFSQLENERRCQALCDKMSSGRRELASPQRQLETLVRDHKNFYSKLFSVVAAFVLDRRCVLIVRAESPHIERRIRVHSTRQLDRVRIASAMRYTKGDYYPP